MLVLHAVRLKGFADTAAIAGRFGLDAGAAHEELLDAQAYGWVSRTSFAGDSGWSLTEAGRRQNEAWLRDELYRAGARADVEAVHERFLPLNAQASEIFTAWQLDAAEPVDTFRRLAVLAGDLGDLERPLVARLPRFGGYHDRFTAALARAGADPRWITGIEVDSCHRIWFELHEDLIATLGLTR